MNFFKFKQPVPPPIPPGRFPKRENVVQWMEEKIEYYEKVHPENLYRLFSPSSGDYLPVSVICSSSEEWFNKHREEYRRLRDKYPQAVKEARENFQKHSYYVGGPREDYV